MDEKEFDEKYERLNILFSKGILSESLFEKKKEELVDLFISGQGPLLSTRSKSTPTKEDSKQLSKNNNKSSVTLTKERKEEKGEREDNGKQQNSKDKSHKSKTPTGSNS